MKLGNCEVWIACDDKPLTEYSVTTEDGEGKQVACFIPSEAGKKFTIHFRNNSGVDTLRFSRLLDGVSHPRVWYEPGETGSIWGVRISSTLRRPYQFSHLTTTDDESSLDQYVNPELGSIQVLVHRVRIVRRKEPVKFTYPTYESVGPIHERSKKIGAHCVSLGEDITVRRDNDGTWTSEKIDQKEGPLATFIFRYRPLALLQAQGIAPLPDSQLTNAFEAGSSQQPLSVNYNTGRPRSEEESRPTKRARLDAEADDVKPDIVGVSESDEDEGELNELKGQLQQILSRIDRMEKKKSKKKSSASSGRVKKEEPGTSSGSCLGRGGEVIDLTLSD